MSIINSIKELRTPIHPAGRPFILAFAVISLLLSFLSGTAGWIGLVLTLWCVYFFRNPDRVTPQAEGLIVSPADGVVSMITESKLPKEIRGEDDGLYQRVSIFLNVFNVHTQRAPVAGNLKKIVYHPGKFLNADLDKASEDNERNTIQIEQADGTVVTVVQIAGLVARRILCDVQVNNSIEAGDVYGIIRFGSRVDVYLPEGADCAVSVGQTMIGGETILAIR